MLYSRSKKTTCFGQYWPSSGLRYSTHLRIKKDYKLVGRYEVNNTTIV